MELSKSSDHDPAAEKPDLACLMCRKRKLKCDREYPVCKICRDTSQNCSYPNVRLKPGPKFGSTFKRRRKSQPASDTVSLVASTGMPEELSSAKLTENLLIPDGGKVDDIAESNDCALNFVRAITVSSMFHPKHETPTTHLEASASSSSSIDGFLIKLACAQTTLTRACKELNLTIHVCQHLISEYFEKSVGFSLFHEPSFSDKIRDIADYRYLVALFAAMLSISTRCQYSSTDRNAQISADGQKCHEYFHSISMKYIDEMLAVCSDASPPFCLLQAMTLATFYKLITGVRGASWRLLGVSVRVAYELHLHLVDYEGINESPSDESSIRNWILNEEKRRCWWALWEMDAFASVIRRSPTAIDAKFIDTYLPVLDSHWFFSRHQQSCLLHRDPRQRWKSLADCKNESPTAWRILFISLMRNAQVLSRGNMQTLLSDLDRDDQVAHLLHYFRNAYRSKYSSEDYSKFSNIIVAFRDACSSMPKDLHSFDDLTNLRQNAVISSRHLASEKFSMLLAIEHARFLIYHIYVVQDAIEGTVQMLLPIEQLLGLSSAPTNVEVYGRGLDSCLQTGDNIYNLLVNCDDEHLKYVNPLFSSIVWLAASTQIFRRVFKRDTAPTATICKWKLLRDAYESYVKFWGTPLTLLHDLDTLEERLSQDMSLVTHFDKWSSSFLSQSDQDNSQVVLPLLSAMDREEKSLPDSRLNESFDLEYSHQRPETGLLTSSTKADLPQRNLIAEDDSFSVRAQFDEQKTAVGMPRPKENYGRLMTGFGHNSTVASSEDSHGIELRQSHANRSGYYLP
ncbi:fungal-specific transcription factor domain-containing protein [Kockiozyma suomiensis]|uniref:fungal-specific transcription factor domain-containing protein n=1 Tax=Kockiozyma suomiensis TaxID=1337062 RepID=UPI00334377A1